MKEGIRLFKIFDIEISLDFSWFIIFFLVTWWLASGYFPMKYPFFTATTYWFTGILSSLMLFIAVLLHELTHSVVANSNGLDIKGIKLFIFGGVAHLSREPQNPRIEFDVAVAGPICSFVLHFVFIGVAQALIPIVPGGRQNPFVAVFTYLAFINVFLGLINLIPAYPLDGGRVLRAFLWSVMKNMRRATAIASGVGKLFALFVIFMGFLAVITGGSSNLVAGLWYVFIGMFLYGAARMGYEHVLIKDTLSGSLVQDIMVTNIVTINSELTLDKVVEDYFFRFHHDSFPVIEDGRVKGILDRTRIKDINKEKWGEVTAGSISRPVTPATTVHPRERTAVALARVAEYELDQIVVIEEGRLVGIVTRRDIMKLLKLKLDLGG